MSSSPFADIFKAQAAEEAAAPRPLPPEPVTGDTVQNPFRPTDVVPDASTLPANPPKPAPDASPFTAIFQAQADQDNERLAGALDMARKGDPDTFAKAKAIADRDGYPIDFAVNNIRDLESRKTASEMRAVLEGNPALRDWFLTGDNHRSVKFDDLHKLSGFSYLMGSVGTAWAEGWQQRETGDIRTRELFGRATPEEIARADKADAEEARDYSGGSGVRGFLAGAPAALAQQLPNMLGAVAQGIKRGTQGAAAGALAGAAAGSVAGGVGAIPGAVAGFTGGFAIGSMGGAAEDAFTQEAGAAFSEFLKMRTDDGKPLDRDTARGAALLVGVANAGLEAVGLHAITKYLPGMDVVGVQALLRSGSREVVAEALKRPTIAAAVKAFAGNAAKGLATETATEVMQEAVTIFAGIAAQKVDGGEFQPTEGREIVSRLVDTAEQTAQAMVLLTPALASPRFARDMRTARAAEGMRAAYENAHQLAASTELNQRAPAGYSDAVKSLLGQGSPDTVSVPAGKMTEMFQELGLNPSDLDARIDGFSDRYLEGVATGSDVHIPMADYQAHIAGTPLGEALIDHQRWHPEMPTVDEARQALAAERELRDAAIEEQLKAAQRAAEDFSAQAQVERQVYDMRVNTGTSPDQARVESTLYGALFNALGVRGGVNPLELFDRQGLEIKRAGADGLDYRRTDELDLALDAVRRGDANKAASARRKGQGASLGDFIASRGGLRESDSFAGELSSRDLKSFKKGRLLAREAGGGVDLDTASLAAIEAGYFPDRVSVDEATGLTDFDRAGAVEDLLAAIDEEVRGRPRFTIDADAVPIGRHLERLETLARELDELGLDVNALTNEQIRAELMKATSADATTGALFQFAGFEGAKNARELTTFENLKSAMDMEANGASVDDIYFETGMWRGPDSKWRFEVSDADAVLMLPEGGTFTGRMVDIFSHDALYRHYPSMADMRVSISAAQEKKGGRYLYPGFDPAGEMIEAGGPTVADARSILLHEIAHAIQEREGFAQGSAPGVGEVYEGRYVESARASLDKAKAKAAARLEEIVASGREPTDAERKEAGQWVAHIKKAQAYITKMAQYEYYRRTAGEVEARNIQIRDEMRERGAFVDRPWLTQDVDADQQVIVSVGGMSVASVPDVLSPEVREFFQSNDKQDLAGRKGDKRGSIQFMDGRTVINLFQTANLSTFLHETGHLGLEVMGQVAALDTADPQLKADFKAVLAYIGAEEGKPIPREAHEKFAKAFETYLSEGKAPSAALARAFERFADWLRAVYGKVARTIGLPAINPELRAIFDRMVATDEQIAEMRQDPAMRPLFDSAEVAGLSGAAWDAYQQTAQKAVDDARGELRATLIRDKLREATREWRAQKDAIRAEVAEELTQRPVYQVQHYIRTGELFQGAEGPGVDLPHAARRLDKAWLERRFGPDVFKRLPAQVPPIYTARGGMNPDTMAEGFGFSSGEHMVEELMSAPSLARAIVGETERRMRERNGDLLSNKARLSEEAANSMMNGAQGSLLEAELKALMAKAGKGSVSSPAAQLKAAARETIRSKKIPEATRTATFRAAATRAGAAAEKAMRAGDWQAAAEAKRQQIIHHALARESATVAKEVEEARRYLDRFAARKRPAGIAPEYLDQIDGLLDRAEFKRSTSGPAIARREALRDFVARKEESGEMFVIPDAVLSDAQLVSYKDMTVEELSGLRDVVKNIAHLGRTKERLLEKSRLRAFTAIRDELEAATLEQPKKRQQKYRNPTSLDRFRSGVAGLDAWLLRMEQVFQWLDKGDVNGPWTRYVFQRFVDAQNRKGEMQKRYAEKLNEIMKGLPKDYLSERLAVPARPSLSFTRSELYAIALNQGSESNRSKILRGETQESLQGRSFNNEMEMQSALSLLTKEDWDRVQSIWDTLETLWPEIAALQKRLTGVEPPRVERRTVSTPHGDYRGGYYPMVYDPEESDRARANADAAADAMFEKTYLRPATANGFTKTRVEGYSAPVMMSLHVLPAHIEAVIHDVTHREAVRDVVKLFADPQLKAAIDQTLGREVRAEMTKWLQRIASDRGPGAVDRSPYKVVTRLRTNMTLYAMGLRLSTVMAQFVGFSNSLEKVKARHLGAAMVASLSDPQGTWDLVQSKSGEMRDRTNNLDRDTRFALRKLEGKAGLVASVQSVAFYGVAMADRIVTVPTWLGAYNQHLRDYPTDEAGAVRAGDAAVRLTQGAGGAKDMSSILGNRTEMFSLLTMFYSYFNVLYNRERTLGRDVRAMVRDGTYEDLPHLVARSIFLVILPAVLADAIAGKFDDDDKDNLAWWAFKKASLYPFMSLPIGRDIAGAVDSGRDYALTPMSRAPEIATKLIISLGEPAELDARITAKRAAELTGYAFGLPIGMGVSAADNVWQGMEKNDFKWWDVAFNRKSFGDERK